MNSPVNQRYLQLFLAVTTAFLVLFTVVACDHQEVISSVVQVDYEHDRLRDDGKPYLVYQIPAGEEFVLDATGYEFDPSPFMYNYDSERGAYSDIDLNINRIEILIGQIIIEGQEKESEPKPTTDETHIYHAEWDSKSQRQYINAQALIPGEESPPLTRFEAGREMIVSIGHLEKDETANEELFYSFWSGLINIQG